MGVTVNCGIGERKEYKPSLNKETKRGLIVAVRSKRSKHSRYRSQWNPHGK